MSASVNSLPLSLRQEPYAVNDTRGTLAMSFFIATEAALFAALFCSYWYVASQAPSWPPDKPPRLHYAIPMLVILLLSSVVLHWGESQLKKHKFGAATLGLVGTIVMGIGFLIFSVFEYKEGLASLKPTTDVYGALFYTIVTLHAAHVVVGLCMLSYVLLLPSFEPRKDMPHRPYHNATLYWHFVDVVWLFVVFFLYITPNIRK
jgi:heme/copper-type cytochrome/quinol oxidase subunit 3